MTRTFKLGLRKGKGIDMFVWTVYLQGKLMVKIPKKAQTCLLEEVRKGREEGTVMLGQAELLATHELKTLEEEKTLEKSFSEENLNNVDSSNWLGWHWHLATVDFATGILTSMALGSRHLAQATWLAGT